ncbi:ferredoxin [Mycobacterium sp. CVI_P3]|uniref:Ferredoxin n=1 Tax=Mycobacterium pinniadriaticum TaxID=2994102 RepID=A0ABT3SAM5_9MYCO|nr:ferredoxin [Mycobacterium pinniadriaticum]MCX2929919.1 ferredoxin [Mycobacterium pinniadriaticum]MCX2936432.1 ferredoxin [Mycobacterium pinniadriaticum]
MHVSVNYERCEGHAVCVEVAPTVFQISDDDEQVRVVDDSPDEALRTQVVLAARRCPIGAITVAD